MESGPITFEKADVLEFDTIEALDTVVSPFRLRILACFREPGSIKEAADALGVGVTRLYHHVHRLVGHGFLVEVGERPSGKTVERLYSIAAGAIRPSQAFLDTYGAEGTAELMRLAFRTAEADMLSSVESDPSIGDQRDRFTISYTRLQLDEEALRELVAEIDGIAERYRTGRTGDIEVALFGVAMPIAGDI